MKPELMAEYMRKRREKLKEIIVNRNVQETVNTQPEPKKEEKVNGCSPVEAVLTEKKLEYGKGLIIHPDRFNGAHPPEYYKNLCMFCGCPETKLMTRNGFKGYLCESHSFE